MSKSKFRKLKQLPREQVSKNNSVVEACFFANEFHILHVEKFYKFFTENYFNENENVLHVADSSEYMICQNENTDMYFRSLLKAIDGFNSECEIDEIRFFKAGNCVKGSGILNLPKAKNNMFRVIFNFRQQDSPKGSYICTSAENLSVKICRYKSYCTVLVPSMTEIKLYLGSRIPGTSTDVAHSLYLVIDFSAPLSFSEIASVKMNKAHIETTGSGFEKMLEGLASKMGGLDKKISSLTEKYGDLSKLPGLQGLDSEKIKEALNSIKDGKAMDVLKTHLQEKKNDDE